ncbi:MAG: HAD domain-containing protein [Ginsengibacter sp.]
MLIFLDIDGVMVPAKSWVSPEFLLDEFPIFSSKAVLTLNKVITDEDTVILTTSHKSKFNLEKWKNIFLDRGIHLKKIKSLPGNFSNLSRKDELLNYFYCNNVQENFVIIDDDKSLNELPKELKDNLIQTSSHIGLREEHVEEIKSILNRTLKSV